MQSTSALLRRLWELTLKLQIYSEEISTALSSFFPKMPAMVQCLRNSFPVYCDQSLQHPSSMINLKNSILTNTIRSKIAFI